MSNEGGKVIGFDGKQFGGSASIWSTPLATPPRGKRVSVLICDPPWRWTGGKSKAPKYETSSIKGLHALAPTVKALGGKDSLMLMWCTIPTLADAMALLASYGYDYKSAHIWKKPRIGTGFYSRNNAEVVLVGRRGRPGAPIAGQQSLTIFEGTPFEKKHSSKPDWLHKWVERHYATAEKIELFARVRRAGWDCIGTDLGKLVTPTGIVDIAASGPARSTRQDDEEGSQASGAARPQKSVRKAGSRSRKSPAGEEQATKH